MRREGGARPRATGVRPQRDRPRTVGVSGACGLSGVLVTHAMFTARPFMSSWPSTSSACSGQPRARSPAKAWLAQSFAVVACVATIAACATSTSDPPSIVPSDGGTEGADASTCGSSETACRGGCVDTRTATTDCGVCGSACAMGEQCCGGSCSSDPACRLKLTSLSSSSAPLNGGTYVTLRGSGFVAGLRAYVGDGRAPVRVVDSRTAIVLIPPAPAGSYGVSVAAGGQTASMPHSFRYAQVGSKAAWVEITMSSPRGNIPALTVLQDGRVLIAGGTSGGGPDTSLDTADVYDPVAQSTTPAAGRMSARRFATEAITLLDGRALVIGVCNTPNGCADWGAAATAELFDPTTNTFTPSRAQLQDRSRIYARPILLPDGRVLIQSQGETQFYDPSTDTFTLAPFALGGGLVRLRDGKIFDGAKIYDSDVDTVTATGGVFAHGVEHLSTLPDGRVLSAGGATDVGGLITPHASVDLFDPKTMSFATMAYTLGTPRLHTAATLVGDGAVLIIGGNTDTYPDTAACQSYMFQKTNAVQSVREDSGNILSMPPLPDPNMDLIAVTLLDGSVLAAGGSRCGGASAYPYVYFLQSEPLK